MKEANLMAAVMDMARLFGWRTAHFRPAMTRNGWRTPVSGDGVGWPDLCLVRDRVVFAEVKGDGGRLSPEQCAWRDWLLHAGAEWHCWTPADWESGAVDRVLQP